MRGEILFLLSLVGFNGAARSYYSRSDGWSSAPDWVGPQIGDLKDSFNIPSDSNKLREEFWGFIDKRTKDNNEKEIKHSEKAILEKKEEIKKEIAEIVAKIEDVKNDKNIVKDEIDNHLYYPCKDNEEDCVREYLTINSQCAPVYRYKNKHKIYMEKSVSYLPNFNFTISINDCEIDGLDGKVEQFYVNKKTGNLIFAVDFKSISIDSKMSYFVIHQRGKEPVVVGDYIKAKFAPTVITAVIPLSYYGLSLKDSLISAEISGVPVYEIGPKVSKNPDPTVQRTVLAYSLNVKTAIRELFLTEAYNFFINYLQNYICDFGIRL